MHYFGSIMRSPIGNLLLLVDEQDRLCRLEFHANPQLVVAELEAQGHRFEQADERIAPISNQLTEYFQGKRTRFSISLEPAGTDFQRQVWSALVEIPYGSCCSYGDIARTIGNPRAVRAVGAANGANPIPIIIPCHRVIGSRGEMVGYSGGMEIKTELLKLEGYLLL